MRMHDVITKPVITEKAIGMNAAKTYVFNVNRLASKDQIKESIEKAYKVEVKEVKTLVRKGKTRRVGRRGITKSLPNVKKAYVSLKKGSIDTVAQG